MSGVATVEHPDCEAFSELVNALQAATLLATELDAPGLEHVDQTGQLQDALRRAVTALRRLQPR